MEFIYIFYYYRNCGNQSCDIQIYIFLFCQHLNKSAHFLVLFAESLKVTHKSTEDERPVAAPHPYKYELERLEYTDKQLDTITNPQVESGLRLVSF